MLSEEYIKKNKHILCINTILYKQKLSEELLYELISYYSIKTMVKTQNPTKQFLNKILDSDKVCMEDSYKCADDFMGSDSDSD